jgi:5-methylthioadenosine/S-adenosylhomocysteine deaminase
LILGRPTQVVHSIWIDGKPIAIDGKIKTINVEELRQTLFKSSDWYTKLKFNSVAQMEPHYRTIMDLP